MLRNVPHTSHRPSLARRQRLSSTLEVATPVDSVGARVLVIDRELRSRALSVQLLRENGFFVVETESDTDALAVVERENIDLVLLDTVLNTAAAGRILRRLRDRFSQKELPVIAVTPPGDDSAVAIVLEAGASDVVTTLAAPSITLSRINTHVRLRQTQAALQQSQEQFTLAAEGANDGLWHWDLRSNQVYYSPRWAALLGIPDSQLSSTPDVWLNRIHTEDRLHVESELEKHLTGESSTFGTELRMQHSDGSYRWMLCRALAVTNHAGVPQRLAGSLTDITEGKAADALTGLPNRVLFAERLQRCTDRRKRDANFSFALLYVDLDNFKLVNDSLGHDFGDRLLLSVARRLEASVHQAESFVSRLGGDEFAVLLEGVATEDDAKYFAGRILDSLSAPVAVGGGREVFASMSVGISLAGDVSGEPTDMLQEADIAMYQAKKQGRSCFRVFDPIMKRDATRRLIIENELRRAVERNELRLDYQPIVTVQNGQLVGFEALVRWDSAELGSVSPSEFIPIAEDTGLIVAVGKWVLEESCAQMVEWKSADERFSDVTISVNLSSRQLAQPDIVTTISEILHRTCLPPGDLKLEVTESAIIENPEAGATLLSELRACGVKIAIDDFGTGYSSLAYLHRLPLDALKIDRSFVEKVTESEDNRAIVGTIITLADRLNLAIVAEGIETQEQRELLHSMGCEFAQGFYFSRPIPAHDVTTKCWSTTVDALELHSENR